MSGGATTRIHPEDLRLLSWKFLDGCATNEEQQQLSGCLTEHETARAIYLQCVQLHIDLMSHFGQLPASKIVGKAPAKAAMPALTHVVSPLPQMSVTMPF